LCYEYTVLGLELLSQARHNRGCKWHFCDISLAAEGGKVKAVLCEGTSRSGK